MGHNPLLLDSTVFGLKAKAQLPPQELDKGLRVPRHLRAHPVQIPRLERPIQGPEQQFPLAEGIPHLAIEERGMELGIQSRQNMRKAYQANKFTLPFKAPNLLYGDLGPFRQRIPQERAGHLSADEVVLVASDHSDSCSTSRSKI